MGACCSEDKKDTAAEKKRNRFQNGGKSKATEENQLKRNLNQVFDKYDSNHDGALEKTQISAMVKAMAQKNHKKGLENEEAGCVKNFIQKADTNKDGVISKDEFYEYYSKSKR